MAVVSDWISDKGLNYIVEILPGISLHIRLATVTVNQDAVSVSAFLFSIKKQPSQQSLRVSEND